MSDLHIRIMNIPCELPDVAGMVTTTVYKMGHRDARHAAASLASSCADLPPTLSAAMELPEVRALVEAMLGAIEAIDAAYDGPDDNGRYSTKERAALAPFTEAKP